MNDNHDDVQNISDNSQDNIQQDNNDDIQSLCDDLERQVHTLQTQLKDKEQENDKLLRAYADVNNNNKRLEKQNEDIAKFSNTNFIKNLLTVADNLEMALATIPSDQKDNEIIKNLSLGVEMTNNELLKIFEKNQVEKISPKIGELFDHNWHQAISSEENDKYDENSIVKILQHGFKLHDRILRPAMVIIAKKSS